MRAVTTDGDLVGAGWVSGGSDRKPSTLEITSEVEKARAELADAEKQAGELSAALSGALAEQASRQDAAEQALAALNESDAAISAIYEQLGRLGQDARAADDEWQRLIQQRNELEAGRNQTVEELAQLEQRLHNAQQEPTFEAQPVDRQASMAAAEQARAAEVEARLAVRTAEERANAVRGRADSLRRAAAAEREARLRAQRAREAREHAAAVAAAVAESGRLVAQRLSAAVAVASRARDQVAAERQHRAGALTKAREEVNELSAKIAVITDSLHRDEVAKAQAALRIEQLEEHVLEQFGMATADLIAEYGPDVALPPPELEMAEYEQARERGEQVTAPAPMPFDRPTQERRAKKAERELNELGRVNPLALEEFAALEERYNFLSTQLEDVKAARKGLLDVIADVDERILQVFTEAYADVEREFRDVFSALFPGGEGRLLLTDPDDMLTTGIEVEARPPGKKIKRLSLLSGGEKSLTAVAMLVAIFRARPSPFYVMDEVEAALDDVNLRRLLGLFEQLRSQSQLIVITHQKPTMEVADALYGVTMRDDGITAGDFAAHARPGVGRRRQLTCGLCAFSERLGARNTSHKSPDLGYAATPQCCQIRRAAAVQAHQQLVDEPLQPIHNGGRRFNRGCQQRPRHRHRVGTHRQHLGGVHAGADAARRDDRHVGQRVPHFQQGLRGRDAPLGQRRVADLAVPDELFDPCPRRAARARNVDGRDRAVDQFRGGRRTDAVADLLQNHRIADRPCDVAQPRDGAGEVGVTLVLHRLLQRIRMHRKGIGADVVERLDQIGHDDLVELRQPDVPDQQHVRCHVADAERARGRAVVEHDALRAEHHADAELLGRRGQVAVDGPRQLGPTGHRADQHRRTQPRAKKVGGQVDAAQIGLGERVVRQPVALEAGGDRLIVDGLGQTHVDVAPFAGLHAARVERHRLSALRQWRRVGSSVDRNRGHRRSGRGCAGRRAGAVPASTDQPVVCRHCHSDRPLRRIYRVFRHHVHPVSACGAGRTHRYQRATRRRR